MIKLFSILISLTFNICFTSVIENNQLDVHSSACISCALQTGEIDSIREIVFSRYFEDRIDDVISATQYFEARQDCIIPIPGFIIIASKRHIQSIDEFSLEERCDFIEFLYKIRKDMRQKLSIATIYMIQVEGSNHFHLWLFPRYDWMKKFGKSTQSIKPIMSWALEHLNNPENIEKVKEAIKKLKQI